MADHGSPRFSCTAALRVLLVRMSSGAVALSTARSRCAASSAWTSARPRSSSAASTRVPFFGPSRTSAGLLPMNCGVVASDFPATIVQCSERWWPS